MFRQTWTRFRRLARHSSTQADRGSTKPAERAPLELRPVQLAPNALHRYLYGRDCANAPPAAHAHLQRLELPALRGTAFQHLADAARRLFQPYHELLERAQRIADHMPAPPEKWQFRTGWTKYNADGTSTQVQVPDADLLFFDVEVCVTEGQIPTLAVALSETNWYSWCSGRLVNDDPVPDLIRPHHLIPMEDADKRTKLIIGHNVGYDRARIREQYYLEESSVKVWDTMSMNTVVQGMADHQRLLYEKKDVADDQVPWLAYWRRRACKNALDEVHARFFPERAADLDKTLVSVFVEEPASVVRAHFQPLAAYCAADVRACARVFARLYPAFRERAPAAATSLGMLHMADAYLPVTHNWRRFYAKCESDSHALNNVSLKALVQAAAQLKADLAQDNRFESDPWMWVSDWSQRQKAVREPAWFANLFTKSTHCQKPVDDLVSGDVKMGCVDVPRVFGICYGPYPLFHKRDYGWGFIRPVPKEGDGEQQLPEFIEVPLQRQQSAKFPARRIAQLINDNIKAGFPDVPVNHHPDFVFAGFEFYRLPHPKGEGLNVGSPFAKDLLRTLFAERLLRATRFAAHFDAFAGAHTVTRFWTNYRDRFNEQVACWLDAAGTRGAIAPAIVPSGTITRRAVHKLWLTSANARDGLLGSDLKSMVQCAPGWRLVGADVDSQEQWLAALFGDVLQGDGHAGSTPFSNMQLAGAKHDRTDLHSVVARTVGITRDSAKVLNYARLYGSGLTHAADFLVQQGLPEAEARETSHRLFGTTKGTAGRYLELNPRLVPYFRHFLQSVCPNEHANGHLDLGSRTFLPVSGSAGAQSHLFEDWLRHNMSAELRTAGIELDGVNFLKVVYADYPIEYTLYKNGFESATFNFLEICARAPQPRTPILDCRLTSALEPLPSHVSGADDFFKRYKRTAINWVVQSSAVDFLHLLLVCMQWLCAEYGIRARFVISIHDEIRFLVREEDRYRCALALSLSNLLVRAAIMEKMGIPEMPMSIAFFSQVDVDTVLRKEVDTPCTLPDGQQVPDGESLTIEDIIDKTGGSLQPK